MSEEKKENCCCGHDHEKENGCCCGHDHDHECDCGHDDCDCGCGETVTLAFDDGEEAVCNVLGVFEALDREYIALLPVGDDEVIIYRHKSEGEESELLPIESDEEYDAVAEVFESLFDEEEEDEE